MEANQSQVGIPSGMTVSAWVMSVVASLLADGHRGGDCVERVGLGLPDGAAALLDLLGAGGQAGDGLTLPRHGPMPTIGRIDGPSSSLGS